MPHRVFRRTFGGMTLRTPRMDLVPATAPLLLAEMEGGDALARTLGARVGPQWPPDLYDADAVEWSLDQVRADPRFEEWGMRYLVVREADGGGREVVGVAGYKGPPDAEATVEVGYAVVPAYRRRGLATEAVLALVEHALEEEAVDRIVAHTLPHLDASLGVLRRTGFRFEGHHEAEDGGVVRYVRTRR